MGEHMKRTRDRLEEEFKHISSNETWTKDSLETMKNILKSMYYIDVICAMKDGESYPGSEYMGMSYATRHGGNGYSYRPNMNGMSGRRYYDDERENAKQRLYAMMENEPNNDVRMAIQNAIRELEH